MPWSWWCYEDGTLAKQGINQAQMLIMIIVVFSSAHCHCSHKIDIPSIPPPNTKAQKVKQWIIQKSYPNPSETLSLTLKKQAVNDHGANASVLVTSPVSRSLLSFFFQSSLKIDSYTTQRVLEHT